MTVRVRFAPSPTGHLHIGGLRTALYNFLLAKAQGGKFILRVEDTDRERSNQQYEELQKAALQWAGVRWDEGPKISNSDDEGTYGPYRQSERTLFYERYANQLINEGKAFYCFCSDEELAEMKAKAIKENRPPHYDGRYRNYSKAQALQRIALGERPVVRFKVPLKSYVLHDLVRGRVVFPENMVGDFVIMRSNGLPVYNFCCVVDDWLMKITHVIRGEDHLSNTVRQLMLYEALGVNQSEMPKFAHVSLLIGADRQKLSKRHGVVSVDHYREQGFLPQALTNYLCLLGWSHPREKEVFRMDEIAKIFSTERFTKASAIYDLEKLRYVNGQHLRQLASEQLLSQCHLFIPQDHLFYRQSSAWQHQCLQFFTGQIQLFCELPPLVDGLFDTRPTGDKELQEILGWDSTPAIIDYLKEEVRRLLEEEGKEFPNAEDFERWPTHIKKELKVKGKHLFKGMRAALTGRGHGPELKDLIPLTPLRVLKVRMENISASR